LLKQSTLSNLPEHTQADLKSMQRSYHGANAELTRYLHAPASAALHGVETQGPSPSPA
jgi:hypothetical protein